MFPDLPDKRLGLPPCRYPSPPYRRMGNPANSLIETLVKEMAAHDTMLASVSQDDMPFADEHEFFEELIT